MHIIKDDDILKLMNQRILDDIGLKPVQEPPRQTAQDVPSHRSDSEGNYITYGDNNTIGESGVVNIFNVTYTSHCKTFAKAHDWGKRIYAIAENLFEDYKYDLLDRPVLNGLNDDVDGAGKRICVVLLQFSYVKGD